MKKIFYVFALIGAMVLTSCNSDVQTPDGDKTKLWPAAESEGNLMGFIDAKGNWAIKAQYEQVYKFSCGWCLVREEGATGEYKFIDKKNNTAKGFDQTYLSTAYFYYNRLTFKDGEYYGKYDNKFNTVIKADYKALGATADNGYCVFSSDLKNYGYLDKNGKKVISDDYYRAYEFADGIAVVVENINETYKMGVIDGKGKYLIEPQNKGIMNMGEARIGFQDNKGKVGMWDKNGKELVEAKYDGGSPFSCGLAMVAKNGKYGYINTKGNEVIDTQFFDATDFADDVAWVVAKEGGRSELINKKGASLLTLKEGEVPAGQYHNGLCLVYSQSAPDAKGQVTITYRYIDKKGEQVYKWDYTGTINAPKYASLREMSAHEMLATEKGYLFEQVLDAEAIR